MPMGANMITQMKPSQSVIIVPSEPPSTGTQGRNSQDPDRPRLAALDTKIVSKPAAKGTSIRNETDMTGVNPRHCDCAPKRIARPLQKADGDTEDEKPLISPGRQSPR
jgi:hypothetical protein